MPSRLDLIHQQVVRCERCSRLRQHCLETARIKRKSFNQETYWGRPITGFGDPQAQMGIVGLAPAAHGGNRTGRIFTGDRSGDWLYRALFKAGFANQPHSQHRNDGLKLQNCYITCVVKCAPPDNKPLPIERENCAPYLQEEIQELKNVRVWVALGQIALQGLWPFLNQPGPRPKFGHGVQIQLKPHGWLLLSYHPSQQNTFTGRLTEPMFDQIFHSACKIIKN